MEPAAGSGDGRGPDVPAPGTEYSQVCARISWVGESWLGPAGRREMLASWPSSCGAVGRNCGSLAMAAVTRDRSRSGTGARSGVSYRTRYKMAFVSPVPNGDRPAAA